MRTFALRLLLYSLALAAALGVNPIVAQVYFNGAQVIRDIAGADSLANSVKVYGTDPNCYWAFYVDATLGPVTKSVCSGGDTDVVIDIPSGKAFVLKGNGTELYRMTAAGVSTESNAGRYEKTLEIPAGAMTIGGGCSQNVDQVLVSGADPINTVKCTDSDSDFVVLNFPLPKSWDRSSIKVALVAESTTNQNTLVVGTDLKGRCTRANDVSAAYSATNAVTHNLTFGNAANWREHGALATLTPGTHIDGTCTSPPAGEEEISVSIRARVRATPTTATMGNVHVLRGIVKYKETSPSDA